MDNSEPGEVRSQELSEKDIEEDDLEEEADIVKAQRVGEGICLEFKCRCRSGYNIANSEFSGKFGDHWTGYVYSVCAGFQHWSNWFPTLEQLEHKSACYSLIDYWSIKQKKIAIAFNV